MKRMLLLVGVVLFCVVGYAQRTITGVVTDDAGEPLIGANVVAEGTDLGTVTDFDGSYSLSVTENAKAIIFSYTGYATQKVELGASNEVSVVLAEGKVLEEVVVTAMGIQKDKRALGYAVTELGGEQFEAKVTGDVSQLLKGKVAGVNITSTSGVSGAGSNIVIRGYSSISGSNQPLFVVDGVPFNTSSNAAGGSNGFLEGGQSSSSRFLDLDPNNIESINVLKGLAATTVYGEQGRNGVILVKTKLGSAKNLEQKLSVTLEQSVARLEIASLPDFQNNYGGGFHQNFGFFFSNWGPNFNTRGGRGLDENGTTVHPLSRLSDPTLRSQFPEFQGQRYQYRSYQPTEGFFRDGSVSRTSLNISGGTETARFTGNFAYHDEAGFTPNNSLERINGGFGGFAKLGNKLEINGSINYARTSYVTPPISYGGGSGIFAGGGLSVFSDVFYAPRNIDLNNLPFQAPGDNRPVYYRSGNDILNPRWTTENAFNTSNVDRIFGQVSLKYPVTDWLSLGYQTGIDNYSEELEYVVNRVGVSSDDYNAVNTGYYRTTKINNTIWDQKAFAQLSFENIAEGFDVDGVFGFNSREDIFDRDGIESRDQLVFGFIDHPNFTTTTSVNSLSNSDIQRFVRERLIAAYGSITLDYKNYAYLTLSGRNDWTSTVEKENNSIFYPSASISFVPTELWAKNETLNFMKVRVGYGTSAGFPPPYSTRNILNQVGRQFIDRDGSVVTTNSNAVLFNDNGAGANLGNPNLRPELHSEIEVGVETRLFNNILGFDISAYTKNTRDLINSTPLDPATGYTSTTINIGQLRNEGIELGIDITPLKGPLQWNLFINFNTYRSIVEDLGADLDQTTIEGFTNLGNFAVPGEVFGVMQGSRIRRAPDGQPLLDGAGFYINDEQGIIGNPHPDFTTTFTNTLSYKGISLNVQFDYRKGGDFYSGSARALLARGITQDTDFDRTQAFVIDGVQQQPDGTFTKNQTMITATNLYFTNYGFGPAELNVFDGTTYRLRDISLAYRLPSKILEKTPFGDISLTLNGQNLWYFVPGVPEHTNVDTDALGLGADSNGLGFEFLNGPSVRRYGASLKVKF